MLELQAGVGFGGAAKRFYHDHRTLVASVILSVAGIATGTASALAISQGVSPAGIAIVAAAAVLACGMCLFQTRHPVLAIVTSLAPLPGLLWAAPISGGSESATVPVLAYGSGFAVAALATEARISRVLEEPECGQLWPATVSAQLFCVIMAVLWFHGTAMADAALQAVADSGLAMLSVAALLPVAHDLIRLDEEFVAQANRSHEWRGRLWGWVANITIPRWAFSFTGVSIVMLALGWYGSGPVLRPGDVLKVASLALAVGAAGLYARSWREGVATGLIWAMAALFALWMTGIGTRAPFASVGLLQIATLMALLTFYGLGRALVFTRQGDPPVIAQRRSLELAEGQWFASAGAGVTLLPTMAIWPGSVDLIAGMVMACAGSITLVPAASIALEVLLPRRRSVEELYGRRRPAR